jgi:hypothetical protein
MVISLKTPYDSKRHELWLMGAMATSIESNAERRTRDEVHSLKAEQYSPLLETPTEGAANSYDLWPYTRDEW